MGAKYHGAKNLAVEGCALGGCMAMEAAGRAVGCLPSPRVPLTGKGHCIRVCAISVQQGVHSDLCSGRGGGSWKWILHVLLIEQAALPALGAAPQLRRSRHALTLDPPHLRLAAACFERRQQLLGCVAGLVAHGVCEVGDGAGGGLGVASSICQAQQEREPRLLVGRM
mgnify:CR=1 FL=1